MSGSAGNRQSVLAVLEWMRLAGVTHLTRRAATIGTAGATHPPRAPIPEAAAPPAEIQIGLFGGANATGIAGTTAPGRGRRRGPEASVTPLAGAEAPAADSAAEALRLIREDLGECTRCRLSEKRSRIVFGVGDPDARLIFVGEGPGVDEDRQGEPFVGRAGQLLTRIIESMGFRREDVYIANVVKCRPPDNRTPQADEIATCSPFLFQQVAAIRPRVIVCLGTPAAQTVLGTRGTITHLRGRFHDVAGYRVMPTFHPAYLLRNPAAKKDVWEDMKQVMAFLKSPD